MKAPIPNSYRLSDHVLAGEYPGDLEPERAREKIGALLDAGVRVFVDLTTPEDRMAPYDAILAEEALRRGVSATRVSYPIPDVDVSHPDLMNQILDDLEYHASEGCPVYVHCWGGVGRTGLVIGCHLVRRGAEGEAALATVKELFGTMSPAKVRRHGGMSPQTSAQCSMVRSWRASDVSTKATRPRTVRRERTSRDRYVGAMLGLAAGDALGTTLEFRAPGTFAPIGAMLGGGPFGLEPGQWTDDTSMALCLAESLVKCKGFDAVDQMQRYLRWLDHGHWSSTGARFDVGNTVRSALESFRKTGVGFSGSTAENSAGNGSLMRLAPVPLFFASDPELAIRMSGESSRTTHGTAAAVDACRYFAGLLLGALRGEPKATLLEPRYSPVPGLWDREPLHAAVAAVADGSFRIKSPPTIRGTGYVIDALEAALWAFHTTDDFRSGALAAVNLGNDADTTGAIYGQLAGTFYGYEAIPAEWRNVLSMPKQLIAMAEALLERSDTRFQFALTSHPTAD
ncbi:MAG: ADP-ribosylglycohydrolase family protein [bacterium]